MPDITVIYWNIENFGDPGNFAGNYVPLSNFIAQMVYNAGADILCIMEVKQPATVGGAASPLDLVRQALENADPNGPVGVSWYFDWIPGSFINALVPGPAFNIANDVGFTFTGHNEGYAVFWKQNIDRFIIQRADPLDAGDLNDPFGTGAGAPPAAMAGAPQANAQSNGVTGDGMPGGGGDIIVPMGMGGGEFTLPAGTTVGAGGVTRAGIVVVPAGGPVGPGPLNTGDIIPTGTILGGAGLILNNAALPANPVVIPGGHTITNIAGLTLPLGGTTLVPEHVLSLVMSGRVPFGGAVNNFAAGGWPPAGGAPPWWEFLRFATGGGAVNRFNSRRPAFCTIKTTHVAGGAVADLIPITIYHVPNCGPGPGMTRGALSRSLYQAYNHGFGTYVDNNRAIFGGDFNQRLNAGAAHYQWYTANFGAGGANCNNAGAPNIRAYAPAPAMAPAFPIPPPMVLGRDNNPLNKSMIRMRYNPVGIAGGNSALSANTDDYRKSPIDNIFYRGFVPVQAPQHAFGAIYDLIKAVSGGVAPAANFYIPAAIIQAFDTAPIFHLGGAVMPVAPAFMGFDILVPATLLADIQAGGFGNAAAAPAAAPVATGVANPAAPPMGMYVGPGAAGPIMPARRAAEFLIHFVSDHLPVIFEMNL